MQLTSLQSNKIYIKCAVGLVGIQFVMHYILLGKSANEQKVYIKGFLIKQLLIWEAVKLICLLSTAGGVKQKNPVSENFKIYYNAWLFLLGNSARCWKKILILSFRKLHQWLVFRRLVAHFWFFRRWILCSQLLKRMPEKFMRSRQLKMYPKF